MGKLPKISPERIQVRFSTDYVEVNTGEFEPHLNHVPRNRLIINEFNILHREMIDLAYLFDIQLIISNLMFGDLRYSRRFTEFFGGF